MTILISTLTCPAFRDALDAALDYALCQLEQAAVARAIHGVPRPVFYKGEQVGEWREHDERLTMFLLRFRRRARFGPWLDREEPPIDRDAPVPTDDSGLLLDFHLRQIVEFAADSPDDGDNDPSEPAPA